MEGARLSSVTTPEEEVMPKFPTRKEGLFARYSAHIQILLLLFQVCLTLAFVSAVWFNSATNQEEDRNNKIVIVFDRKWKKENGYKFSIYSEGSDTSTEEVILTNVPEELGLPRLKKPEIESDNLDESPEWPIIADPPVKSSSTQRQTLAPSVETIIREGPRPPPPVPPPKTTTNRPRLRGPKDPAIQNSQSGYVVKYFRG